MKIRAFEVAFIVPDDETPEQSKARLIRRLTDQPAEEFTFGVQEMTRETIYSGGMPEYRLVEDLHAVPPPAGIQS